MDTIFLADPWRLVETRPHREQMKKADSFMAVENGHMRVSGCFEEKYSGECGRPVLDILSLRVHIDGKNVNLAHEDAQLFSRVMDLRTGILTREFAVRRKQGCVQLRFERFLSVTQPEVLAIRVRATADYDCRIALLPALDARAAGEALTMLPQEEEDDALYMTAQANQEPRSVICCAMTVTPEKAPDKQKIKRKEGLVREKLLFDCRAGQLVGCDKFVAVTTSRDYPEETLRDRALAVARRAQETGYDALRDEQVSEWKRRWESVEESIQGDTAAQQAERLRLFKELSVR